MNAVSQLRQSESHLVAAIEQATATVNAIGTSKVEAAMTDLHEAVCRARSRLDTTLAALEGMIGHVAASFEDAARALAEDAAPADPTPQLVRDLMADTEAAQVPAPVPEPARPTDDGATAQEEAEAYEAEQAAARPANRIAELLGAEPSANGKHEPAGKGRRRGKK
jgi:hypothetical protein